MYRTLLWNTKVVLFSFERCIAIDRCVYLHKREINIKIVDLHLLHLGTRIVFDSAAIFTVLLFVHSDTYCSIIAVDVCAVVFV